MNKVAVIGLGYVGLPLALALIKAGKKVIGFDLAKDVVQCLNDGECHLPLWESRVKKEVEVGVNAEFTCNSSDLNGVEAAIICVPTPLDELTQPDHSYVDSAMESIAGLDQLPSLVILESTVSVGYTRNISEKLFGSQLSKCGGNVHVCFSPEREDPGNEEFTNVEIPKVVGGMTDACLSKGVDLYMDVFDHVVRATSLETAELCKLHENTFRAVNISYVNQFRNFASKHGVNFEEVVSLAKSKPFGFMPFSPGVGVGGHCIPVDPHFLLAVAEKEGSDLSIVRDAMNNIKDAARSTFDWLIDCGIQGEILITGASYKDGVSDIRCSPAVELIEALVDQYDVLFWDRNVSELKIGNKSLVALTDEQFSNFEGTVVIVSQAGKSFIEATNISAKRILDARYRVEIPA